MTNPTDTYRYPITVNGFTYIYHSSTPMTDEDLTTLVQELEQVEP